MVTTRRKTKGSARKSAESRGPAAKAEEVDKLEGTLARVADTASSLASVLPYGATRIAVKVTGASIEIELESLARTPSTLPAEAYLELAPLTTVAFAALWSAHPYPQDPCDEQFDNQCAIRMSVALESAGVSTSTFDSLYPGRRCWNSAHKPRHILAAEEMAKWLDTKQILGRTSKRKRVSDADYAGKTGMVAFLNMPNGPGKTIDHIDLWDGKSGNLKAGSTAYFAAAEEVWFWDVS